MSSSELSAKEKAKVIEECSTIANEKARSQKWDMNMVVFMFAIMLVTVLLLYEGVDPMYMAPIALFGLVMCWFVSWREGKKLYRRYFKQEMDRYFDDYDLKSKEDQSE